MTEEMQCCPYCGEQGFVERGSYAFKCIKCGTKAIREGDSWYYEAESPDEFEQLLEHHTETLNNWFDGVGMSGS